MVEHYKHYIAITSQAAFCSVPLRLDSYSECQFSCSFCFAKSRGGKRSSNPSTETNPAALKERFLRVACGDLRSGVDDMLHRRIPIQFGGMTDPFSPWEKRRQTTFALLNVLADNHYPTIISTKGTLIADPAYLAVLTRGNFYVRFSFTAAEDHLASSLEPGVPSRGDRLRAMAILADAGIPIAARFQPLILGHEGSAVDLLRQISGAGARQVSAEYLKWPMEQTQHHARLLAHRLPGHLEEYLRLGAKRVGREYVLPSALKYVRMQAIKHASEELDVLFGYAENDLLHFNAFRSCCNGADKFLTEANFFEDNILGRLKRTSPLKTFDLGDEDAWQPRHDLLTYLNSHSRGSKEIPKQERWRAYLAEKWSAPLWRGGPLAFHGIEETGQTDRFGLPIYRNRENVDSTWHNVLPSASLENSNSPGSAVYP